MKKGLALLLAVAMGLTMTACARSDVIAMVGKTEIHLPQALEVYDLVYRQMSSYYGLSLSPGDADYTSFVTSMKDMALQLIVEVEVMEQKLNELGLSLTEEELANIDVMAKEEYDATVESYVALYGATQEEAMQMADEQGYAVKSLAYLVRRYEVQEKLKANIVTIVEPTEAQIQSDYEAHVAQQQETYDATPSQYGTDVLYGSVIYYRPAGYRYIKNLVLGFPEENQTEITNKNTEYQTAAYELALLQSQLSSDTELDDEAKADLEAQIAEKDAQVTLLTEELDALRETAREAIRPKAEEVLALAHTPGSDFNALIAEYNEDTVSDPDILQNGYQVSADSSNFVATFTEGAMALASIGDISDLIESSYGFHILQYAGDVPAGAVSLDLLHEEMYTHLKSEMEDQAFTDQMTLWVDNASVKTYTSRFKVD